MPARNRIVELQEPVVARDDFGSDITTWTTRAEVWASFKLLSKPTERYIRKARKVAVVRLGQFGIIRPEVDFDERWRIIEVDGLARTWDVVGIGKGQPGADWKITVKA